MNARGFICQWNGCQRNSTMFFRSPLTIISLIIRAP
jgi:hypothetical protein